MPNNELPSLVKVALDRAFENNFSDSCSVPTGRLLRVLAASRLNAQVGEIGIGYGAGTAWLASGLASSSTLTAVDHDENRVRVVSPAFKGIPTVKVVHGDWSVIAGYGPFDLLFIDAGPAKHEPEGLSRSLSLIKPGGIAVFDDMTPGRTAEDDPTRRMIYSRSDFVCTEVRVREEESVILAVRLQPPA